MPVWSLTVAHSKNVYNHEKELYYGAIAHEMMKSHMGWDVCFVHYVYICMHISLHLNVHVDPFTKMLSVDTSSDYKFWTISGQ